MVRKDWLRTHKAFQIKPELDGQRVHMVGWVHEVRDLGGIKFLLLRDSTGICQVVFKKSDPSKDVLEELDKLGSEDVVYVSGIVAREEKAKLGVEIKADYLKILSKAKQPIPYDVTGKVPANLDTRLNHRILDLRKPENLAIFKIAHTALRAIREFLTKEGFIEVRTPKIIGTATEGGAALFKVDYFGRSAYLAQSPQLYKEQLISVFEKVFEIGPYFRAEESHTRRHVSEFTSVDIEMAFADFNDVMGVLERMVAYVIDYVIRENKEELKILGSPLKPVSLPFKRFTYDQMLEELRGEGREIRWGDDFGTEDNRILGKKHPYFYFITHFPTESKPFYIQPCEDRPEVSESFDLMYQWLELASGGTRISDRRLLEKRLREKNLNPESFKSHLAVFDYGMPIHAGWGLGFDRFLMVLTRRTNIREVILFPRDRFRLEP